MEVALGTCKMENNWHYTFISSAPQFLQYKHRIHYIIWTQTQDAHWFCFSAIRVFNESLFLFLFPFLEQMPIFMKNSTCFHFHFKKFWGRAYDSLHLSENQKRISVSGHKGKKKKESAKWFVFVFTLLLSFFQVFSWIPRVSFVFFS